MNRIELLLLTSIARRCRQLYAVAPIPSQLFQRCQQVVRSGTTPRNELQIAAIAIQAY